MIKFEGCKARYVTKQTTQKQKKIASNSMFSSLHTKDKQQITTRRYHLPINISYK